MSSSIARKSLMALTGLFLCLFLVVHVAGNLPLLLPAEEARVVFNGYAAFLTGLTIIKVASLFTMAAILFHSVLGVLLVMRSRKARAGGYAVDAESSTSPWYARAMGVTGALLFVFLVVHLWDYWYPYQFGTDAVGSDTAGQRDLYGIVTTSSRSGWHAGFYVVCMTALAFHLHHGVYSASRSLGLYSRGFARLVKYAGLIFATLVSGAFAAMSIYLAFMDS